MKKKRYIVKRIIRTVFCLVAFVICVGAQAFDPFVVKDIEVDGLRRISAGTVFNYLPVEVGDLIDQNKSTLAINELYATGFFHDIELKKRGNVLIVSVVERPSIAEIIIEGNELLEEEPLMDGLKDIGLSEGRIYNRQLLDSVSRELFRQYYSQGYYDVDVQTTITPLQRNRVSIRVTIAEGKSAKIKDINIVGNKAFSEEELKEDFNLAIPAFYNFWSSSDQYAGEKLSADIESLKTFYMNRGYLNFRIESVQVSMSPDRDGIYLTINIQEGEQYKVKGVDIIGADAIKKPELLKKSVIKVGELFSQKDVVRTKNIYKDMLGDEGYAFSKVNVVPDVNEKKQEVTVKIFIDQGKKVFVRRIVFTGNDKTKDEVLRREMRQLEGAWYSTRKLERSRLRLQRLGYFEKVDIDTPAVPGTTDQVDIIINVTERGSGSIELSAGYGGDQGFSFGASLSQQNFLGTGNKFSIRLNNSKTNTVYSMSFNNPYYTKEGISRGYNFFFRQTDTEDTTISTYATDDWGGSVSFGFPIAEEERITLGFGYDRLKLKVSEYSPQRLHDFIEEYGDEYASIRLTGGWASDSRNSYYFPTKGVRQSLFAEVTLPGSELTYYKLSYGYKWYYPLTEKLTLSYDGKFAFGDGYDNTEKLPFFQNYYAGGISTVRGYKNSSLGPRDPYDPDDPIGGNAKILSSFEVISRFPFFDTEAARIVTFVDVGNVFDTVDENVDLGELRTSAGFGILWLSPLGSMAFSYGFPLNEKEGDYTKGFQFSLGSSF
ncbi:MAG: outer membrane protein assembly factor BamA [Gammaproteobacteria bacterium]|nr:MAG: outer membrane protein assembly factor BamA [Gammaproteobacteria bacterium]